MKSWTSRAGKILDDALSCIGHAIRSDGSIDAESLVKCQKEYGIRFVQLRQGDIPRNRNRRWISLFFAIEDLLNELERHSLMDPPQRSGPLRRWLLGRLGPSA